MKITASLSLLLLTLSSSAAERPLIFVFTGESNSGGIGRNAEATPAELAARPSVQIMNLTNGLFTFEPLLLGQNNLRDHAGLEGYYAGCHGLELGLANAVEAGSFAGRKQVYLVKTGQGGSKIEQWTPDHQSGYWKKFDQRLSAARRQVPTNAQWVVWFSLGINDAIANTPMTSWKQDTLAHLKRIKKELPGAPIVMTQFQSMKRYSATDKALAEIAAEEPGIFVVDSTGAGMETDQNHWNYAGLKTVAQRMVEATNKALGGR
ncbi:MAG: sialate O-acetylesterase [Kiritimatiellia bacterium]